MPTSLSVAPLSAAARSARRLSQRATEDLLRRILARVTATPDATTAILEEHAEPLIAFSADRRITHANAAGARFFGYDDVADLVEQSTDLLVPVRMRQPDAPAMQPFDTLTTVELPGLRRDGSEPHLSWTFGSVTSTPAPIFVMVVRDRAEIEDALEELYASEQRFRLLVEGVHDHAMILFDPEGRIATWNTGAERLAGWRADEILGQPYAVFAPPEQRQPDVVQRELQTAVEQGRCTIAGWRVRKDGSRFWAETSLFPLKTPDGALQGFAMITHDLTETREAEDAQRRLDIERAAREAAEAGRDRLARLHRAARALSRAATPEEVTSTVLGECLAEVEGVAGAIYAVASDGTLQLMGERGHPPGLLEPAPVPLTMDLPVCNAIRTRTPIFFESADASVSHYPQYESFIRAGGFEAAVSLPLMTGGATIGALFIRYREARELTESDRSLLLTMSELCAQAIERARLFRAETEARAAAEAASRAKDEFLAMLGHELRNPLAPIATAIELMKLRGETHSVREREIIERQVDHITRLVDDLLDISRITRGKLELARASVDIADVVARAVEMASPLLEQRRHRLSIDVPRGLLVNGDADRLAQVLSNLLANAAKYTQRGGNVDVSAVRDGGEIVIRVHDNGEGIAPELLPDVFDLFVQGRRTFDRSAGGLGIGLSLVKNLVSLHGGSVAAASEGVPGRGSELTVRLPALTDAVHASHVRPAPTAPRATGRKRVLVVDDNRDFGEMLTGSLEELGYEVVLTLDGVAALEKLREFHADVAVLDLGLPVLDGFELARKIRDAVPERVPALIAVTGYGQDHDRARTASAGFRAHLVKPVDIHELVATFDSPAA